MNGKASYSSVLNTLGGGEFAIFCGAGISRNSGLPLANELKQYIFEGLGIDPEDTREVTASNLPFEAFMEAISENTDISDILDIFKEGEPNANHILIARLAKNGYLRTIFTTNFDLLIEKALEEEGLKEDVDFKKYYNEEHFSRIDFNELGDKIVIFKIHGSADDKDSIRTTLKAVASESLSDQRMNAIEYLFSTGIHKKVLIVGYSCSDVFDITPQIQRIKENRKKIILIEHRREVIEEIEDVRTKDYQNPFKEFLGARIKCSAEKFIENLWDSLKYIVGEYNPIESQTEWKRHIHEWTTWLEENKDIKHSIPGLLLFKISDFKKAIEYYEKSLEISKEVRNRVGESTSYTNLGRAYRSLGDFKKAIEYYEKSLEISKEMGDKEGESKCYTNLGSAYGGLGNFKKEIEYYESSLVISKDMGDKAEESRGHIGLGVAYYCLGNFKKAIEHEKKSLEISKEMGDKEGESKCYTNLGNAYYGAGDFEKAIEYYEKSLKIYKDIGNKAGESRGYMNLGAAYGSLGEFAKAIDYVDKSLQIFEDIGDKAEESRCHRNLGDAYGKLGHFDKAIKHYEKSLEISKEVGDKEGESKCYENLGGVYQDMRDFKQAIEYYLRAEELVKETRQAHFLKVIYAKLHHTYENLGDDGNAEKYKRMSESIQKA